MGLMVRIHERQIKKYSAKRSATTDRIGRITLKTIKLGECDEEGKVVIMKVSTTTVIGLLAGFVIGIIGLGRANSVSPDLANVASKIHQYMLWIVLLSLLVPLADYFVSTSLTTTIIGFVTRQPFRHLAAFFMGLAVGLLALILLAPQIFQTHF